jgi:hypothetical protein
VIDVVSQHRINFNVVQQPDPSQPAGQTSIATPGVPGQQQITDRVTYVDGVKTKSQQVGQKTVTPPVTQVVNVGTKQPSPVQAAAAPLAANAPLPAGTGASPAQAQAIAQQLVSQRGWDSSQFQCLVQLWGHESGWRINAANASGAYGIPQALPGSKMGSAGSDWANNATTQITWGLGYIAGRYGTPCGAWSDWQAQGWY